ncbi:MAG: spore cortex biosynthesis protein YabQ [Oscillospiraceae bacterium]
MEISVSHQLCEAAASLGLGAAAGFLYDIFRTVRLETRSSVVTVITDMLFWLICAALLFLFGMSAGEGKQRIFMTIFAFLGGALYFCTVSRFMLKLCGFLAEGVRFVLYCLSRPFVWINICLKKLGNILKTIFKYYRKWYRISYDYNRRKCSRFIVPKSTGKDGKEVEIKKNGRYYDYSNSHSDSLRDDHADGLAR